VLLLLDAVLSINHNSGMKEEPSQPAELPAAETSPGKTCYVAISPTVEYYQPPRLGLIHLLAWVTIAAVVMKFNLALETSSTQPDDRSELFQFAAKLFGALQTILDAAILTGGLVFWSDRFRCKSGRIQPGHWIVAIACFAVMGNLLGGLVIDIWERYTSHSIFWIVRLYYPSYWLLMSLAYGWAAFRLREPNLWKCALGLLSLQNMVFAISSLIFSFSLAIKVMENAAAVQEYAMYPVAAFLVIVICCDLFKGLRRDWLHWLGALSPVIGVLLHIVWRVVVIEVARP
jgi:hypothetical protein